MNEIVTIMLTKLERVNENENANYKNESIMVSQFDSYILMSQHMSSAYSLGY